MKDAIRQAERAEAWQSLKALLIPLSLFLACLIAAAGSFLVYNGESVGWPFLVVALILIVVSFVGLVRYQNVYRVKGTLLTDSPGDTRSGDAVGEKAQAATRTAEVNEAIALGKGGMRG